LNFLYSAADEELPDRGIAHGAVGDETEGRP
jgi:hypothetical protein